MRLKWTLLFFVAVLAGVGQASAEPVPRGYASLVKRIEATVMPASAQRGETVVLRVNLDLQERAFTLPATRGDDSEFIGPSRVDVVPDEVVVPVGVLKEPASKVREIPELGVKFHYVEGTTVWERPLVIRPDAKPGEHVVRVKVWFHIMNDRYCLLPLRMELKVPLKIGDAAAVDIEAKYANEVKKAMERK